MRLNPQRFWIPNLLFEESNKVNEIIIFVFVQQVMKIR